MKKETILTIVYCSLTAFGTFIITYLEAYKAGKRSVKNLPKIECTRTHVIEGEYHPCAGG